MAYDGARYLLHERAIAVLSARMINDQNPKRVAAFPTFVNPLRWRAVAELREGYWISDINLNEEFDPTEGRVFFQPESSSAIQQAMRLPDFQSFVRFNQFPLWRVLPVSDVEGAVKVELFDLRFGDPTAPAFVASAIIANGKPGQEGFQFGRPRL